jgi:hypothetical protein
LAGKYAMIHVQQISVGEHDILIKVGGVLDVETVEVLNDVCSINLAKGNKVTVDFDSVLHITREGRRFVQEMTSRVHVKSLPEFMKADTEMS